MRGQGIPKTVTAATGGRTLTGRRGKMGHGGGEQVAGVRGVKVHWDQSIVGAQCAGRVDRDGDEKWEAGDGGQGR